jgi:hypothetical protein
MVSAPREIRPTKHRTCAIAVIGVKYANSASYSCAAMTPFFGASHPSEAKCPNGTSPASVSAAKRSSSKTRKKSRHEPRVIMSLPVHGVDLIVTYRSTHSAGQKCNRTRPIMQKHHFPPVSGSFFENSAATARDLRLSCRYQIEIHPGGIRYDVKSLHAHGPKMNKDARCPVCRKPISKCNSISECQQRLDCIENLDRTRTKSTPSETGLVSRLFGTVKSIYRPHTS